MKVESKKLRQFILDAGLVDKAKLEKADEESEKSKKWIGEVLVSNGLISEKELIKIVQSENGAIFQATLMEKLNIGKVGITRLLDKLEAKQIIERKRRGMTNIVILK